MSTKYSDREIEEIIKINKMFLARHNNTNKQKVLLSDVPLNTVELKVNDPADEFGFIGVNFNNTTIEDVANPVNPQDVATRNWTIDEIHALGSGAVYVDTRFIDFENFPIPLLTSFADQPVNGGQGFEFELSSNGVLSVKNIRTASVSEVIDYRILRANIGGYDRQPGNSAASIVSQGVKAFLGEQPNGTETQGIIDNFGLKNAGDFIWYDFCLLSSPPGAGSGEVSLTIQLRLMQNDLLRVNMISGIN